MKKLDIIFVQMSISETSHQSQFKVKKLMRPSLHLFELLWFDGDDNGDGDEDEDED